MNQTQLKIVSVLEDVQFDFDNYEPIFVEFLDNNGNNTNRYYIYKAPISALAELGDVVIVPVQRNNCVSELGTFKIAQVSATMDDIIDDGEIDVDVIESNLKKFKDIRLLVANLGAENGAFFDDYHYHSELASRRAYLQQKIKERAQIAKQENYYQSIAKYDEPMKELLDEFEALGGF